MDGLSVWIQHFLMIDSEVCDTVVASQQAGTCHVFYLYFHIYYSCSSFIHHQEHVRYRRLVSTHCLFTAALQDGCTVPDVLNCTGICDQYCIIFGLFLLADCNLAAITTAAFTSAVDPVGLSPYDSSSRAPQ